MEDIQVRHPLQEDNTKMRVASDHTTAAAVAVAVAWDSWDWIGSNRTHPGADAARITAGGDALAQPHHSLH